MLFVRAGDCAHCSRRPAGADTHTGSARAINLAVYYTCSGKSVHRPKCFAIRDLALQRACHGTCTHVWHPARSTLDLYASPCSDVFARALANKRSRPINSECYARLSNNSVHASARCVGNISATIQSASCWAAATIRPLRDR